MKTLLAVASLSLFITGCASMPQAANEPLTKNYERIVDISDTSKEKIYEGSRRMVRKKFQ